MQPIPIQSTDFKPVVVAPTFNNAATVSEVIKDVLAQGLTIIVVNDGSTDQTAVVLDDLAKTDARIRVVEHAANLGKAAALATGFAEASRAGWSHVVTIDTDSQHDPKQIPLLIQAAAAHPRALILGLRDKNTLGYPLLSRLGRMISNWLIWLEGHIKIHDSQCGMRVYPLAWVRSVDCRSSRYGFETEILTRAAWTNTRIIEVPVSCIYLPRGEKITHFRPIVDSASAMGMHARLILRAVPRWPGLLCHWLSPLRAWRELKQPGAARSEFATGVAIGVFIACLPAYGLQSVLGLLAAKRLKLNPLSVIAGSQLSIPLIAPFLIIASLALGHFLLHGTWPLINWEAIRLAVKSPNVLAAWICDWIVGGILLGVSLGFMSYFLCRMMFRLMPTNECPT